ncbi:MAG TPA: hypothetical protein VF609_10920 [Flavisolibacter sp.]|jgi:hypothetical protein
MTFLVIPISAGQNGVVLFSNNEDMLAFNGNSWCKFAAPVNKRPVSIAIAEGDSISISGQSFGTAAPR